MISQICDSDSRPEEPFDARADADRRMSELEVQRSDIAARRRALAEPTHKVVVATPISMHHKITLGGVLVNAGFQAFDADALAGLLSADGASVAERLADRSVAHPGATAAELIADLLDRNQRELAARGLFLTWQKRMAAYMDDRAEWLARDEELRLDGEWRDKPMTVGQRWLIRVTCRALKIAMPGHLLRGQAAAWLDGNGANLNYGDFDDTVSMG